MNDIVQVMGTIRPALRAGLLLACMLLVPVRGRLCAQGAAPDGHAGWTVRGTNTGIVWTSKKYVHSAYGNQVVNVLDVDPSLAVLRPVRTATDTAYESVLSMGTRTAALAGVNGGFFCYTQNDICGPNACSSPPNCPAPVYPLSLLIVSDSVYSSNCTPRTSFGITDAGAPVIAQVVGNQGWPGVAWAIGAGPNLVTGGVKKITQEGFCWYTESAPRTAVATTTAGHILLVTIDGRYAGADGMTIDMLATFLIKELKVASAMNLDGGGSSTMFYGGRIVNHPSDTTCNGCCRCVYDGLFAFPK
ncbi:MAG TPA: phosphodiester glycosidase family protein [Candidatus Kapabacteria bacterium]|nr:phosphodiester glycosidase family protein [Candidatus Kapabacteria bacterium]